MLSRDEKEELEQWCCDEAPNCCCGVDTLPSPSNNRQVMYFAVTDQYVIIPLKEVGREVFTEDDLTRIETEIVGEPRYQSHCEAHHKFYFKSMWLNKNGEPDKGNVFMTKREATDWAVKSIRTEIAKKKRELQRLQEKLDDFNIIG